MTTRGELVAATQRWLRRQGDTDFTADVDTMLRNVEARLARELMHSSMDRFTTLTASNSTVSLPADCLHIRSLTLTSGTNRRMRHVTPEVLREGGLWTQAGTPCWYAHQGTTLYLAPSPTAESPVTLDMSYYARLVAMVNDSDTTALLQSNWDMYFYCMLHEAATFLQDERLAMSYLAKYVDIRNTLQERDALFITSGSAFRRTSTTDKV